MRIHELKIAPEYVSEVKDGNKNFEIRFNDRNFQKGDVLRLMEYENKGTYITIDNYGEDLFAMITYVLSDAEHKYLQDGYVCLGIRVLDNFNQKGE